MVCELLLRGLRLRRRESSTAGAAFRRLGREDLRTFNEINRVLKNVWNLTYSTIVFSGAVTGLSAHFTAGSSQLMHWRSVRPEMVTTGTIRFPHFGQRVV